MNRTPDKTPMNTTDIIHTPSSEKTTASSSSQSTESSPATSTGTLSPSLPPFSLPPAPNNAYPSPFDLPPLHPTDPSLLPHAPPCPIIPFNLKDEIPGAFYNDPSDLTLIPYIETYDSNDYGTSIFFNRPDMTEQQRWEANRAKDASEEEGRVNTINYHGEMPPLIQDPPRKIREEVVRTKEEGGGGV